MPNDALQVHLLGLFPSLTRWLVAIAELTPAAPNLSFKVQIAARSASPCGGMIFPEGPA